MSQLYVWLLFACSLMVVAGGFWLQRNDHPSGVAVTVGGLVTTFFSLGFVAGELI